VNIFPYVILGVISLLAAGYIRYLAEKEVNSLRTLREARGLLEEHHVDFAAKIVKDVGEKELRRNFYWFVFAAIVFYLIFATCVVLIVVFR
jgi:hypothetical protein